MKICSVTSDFKKGVCGIFAATGPNLTIVICGKTAEWIWVPLEIVGRAVSVDWVLIAPWEGALLR